MCGICGFVQHAPVGEDDQRLLLSMRETMVHRGPDGAGHRVGPHYAFAHRRLSIVDLSQKAVQPMSNEAGDVWVTFNGEIFNHRAIRADLVARGHVFKSDSDTEVLVHGWEEWGMAVLDRLNGMFAFAVADEGPGRFLLARDRLGIKPLYYFLQPGLFAFASEVKALLQHPACPRRLNEEVLGEQLLFRHVAGRPTLYEGVFELPPACCLLLERDLRFQEHRYWRVQCSDGRLADGKPDAVQFGRDLRAAVDRWMMSDVPIGVQLSGGLDSSIVTQFAAELSPHQMKSFSIGLSLDEYNEAPYSGRVAKAVGAAHRPITAYVEDFDREFDRMVHLMDVPIDHANSLLLHLLCKRAKQEVTVLLTGEGADEILCGYHRYAHFQRVHSRFEALPRVLRRTVAGLPGASRVKKLGIVSEWQRRGPLGMAVLNSAFGSATLVAALESGTRLDLSVREEIVGQYGGEDPLDALLRLDQQVYLVSVLHRQDRVSMGASVEARVPFLDHEFVQCVNALPLHFKIQNHVGKHILRQCAKGTLPEEIVVRSKMGFPIPLAEWFRRGSSLSERLDLLLDARSTVADLFARGWVARRVEEHRDGRANHAEDLWILLTLEMWHRHFIRKAAVPPQPVPCVA